MTMAIPPEDGSKGYFRVVARGCGGTRDYWGNYDCSHEYGWRCEDCPIVREAWKAEDAAFVVDHSAI